ncbi:MAG: hypothetical protein WC284_13440, partial [Candidimonas sp.]
TPEYDTALSFAQYVKSYDEMTMMYGLKMAMEQGSAGKYGSAVLTLKPKPNQVIVKTYKNGNEKSKNPSWDVPPTSVEPEVILHGDIEVVDVKFFEPLTVDNWKSVLSKLVTPTSTDNDFVNRWIYDKIRRNQISENEYIEFFTKHLDRIIKTEFDIIKILGDYGMIPLESLDKNEKIKNFIQTHLHIDEKNGSITVIYDGENVKLNRQLLIDAVKGKNLESLFRKIIQTMPSPIFTESDSKWNYGWNIDFDYDKNKNHIQTILMMLKTHPEVANKLSNVGFFKNLKSELLKSIKSTIINYRKLTKQERTKNLQKYTDWFNHIATWISFLPSEEKHKIARMVISDVHHNLFPSGPMDEDEMDWVKYNHPKMIKMAFEKLMPMLH